MRPRLQPGLAALLTGTALLLAARAAHADTIYNGWAVGQSGTIRHTSDGGATWLAQTSGTTIGLADVFFVDASNGWAVGGIGTIRHTSNGGATWSAQASGTTSNLTGVSFVAQQGTTAVPEPASLTLLGLGALGLLGYAGRRQRALYKRPRAWGGRETTAPFFAVQVQAPARVGRPD